MVCLHTHRRKKNARILPDGLKGKELPGNCKGGNFYDFWRRFGENYRDANYYGKNDR
jgi:hypothetical protein